MEFEVGAIVVLKSGGPPLTVAEIVADGVRCIWFAQPDDKLRSAVIPASCLEPMDDAFADEDEEDDDEEDDEDEAPRAAKRAGPRPS